MIKEKDLERIKELIQTRDDFDIKIGIGLALEKGMTINELARVSVENEWIKEVIPITIPESIKELAKQMLIEGMSQIFTEILNYNENENNK
tara:strand:- start:5448 stop:5720 length:273 start_codon:yes stop_codon:yes gene_type:complete